MYRKEVKTVPSCARDSTSGHYFPGCVQCEDSDPVWRVTFPILGKKVDCKTYSGEGTSIVSEKTYNAIRPKLTV